MANLWNQEGIPHKGWQLEDVIDVREDGQPEWETEYETCMMCGKPRIRYVHIVTHRDVAEEFRVGCNCAEKMTNDYINPEKREKELRNRNIRRAKWLNRQWRISKNGNYFLNIDGHNLVVYNDKTSRKYKTKIDDKFSSKQHDDLTKARMALFDNMEYLKEKGDW